MKATGKMISTMEMVMKLGLTNLVIKDNMLQDKKMVLDYIAGLMEVFTLESGLKIT